MKSLPKFWNLLPESDKISYMNMRSRFAFTSSQNQRNKRVSTFNEILQAIHRFCIQHDKNDWIRCFVCGVMWLKEGIAINNQQMRILISKCKSSINGSLLRIGYVNSLGRTETAAAMIKAVPLLKDNTSELRQWTVRTKSIQKPLIQVILTSKKKEDPEFDDWISSIPKYDEDENDNSFEILSDPALQPWSSVGPGIEFDFGLYQ